MAEGHDGEFFLMMIDRRNVLLALGILPGMVAAVPADAQSQNTDAAKNFIDGFTKKAVEYLLADGITQQEAQRRFKTLLNEGFDIGTIGRFALGRYLREVKPDELNTYLGLFETYLVQVYTNRLSEFRDLGFAVQGARAVGSTDVLVNSTAARSNSGQAAKVDWRVRGAAGGFRIVDVIVEGISMGTSQRDEFASVIQRSGGRVQGLIDALQQRVNA